MSVWNPIFSEPDAERLVEALNPGTSTSPQPHPPPAGSSSGLTVLCGAPLLSKEEERYLFYRMNYAKFVAEGLWMKRSRRRRCVLDQMESLLDEATRIRNRIVESNLRLVVSIAKHFADSTAPLDERVSEAILPLIRAVELFDISRGYCFSTYATNAIRNVFLRTAREQPGGAAIRSTPPCLKRSPIHVQPLRTLKHCRQDAKRSPQICFGVFRIASKRFSRPDLAWVITIAIIHSRKSDDS